MYRSAKPGTGCQGHPGTRWHSLCAPGKGMDGMRERDGASESLACTGFWDGELGCTRSRVSADPAKKIPEPSGSFDGSCPRIINNVGPLWVLFFYR